MGPLGIVAREPVRGEHTDLREGSEDMGVEDFLAIRLVEAFDEVSFSPMRGQSDWESGDRSRPFEGESLDKLLRSPLL